MLAPDTVIFSDPEFLDENGKPQEGADIHKGYLHCHPFFAKQVWEGIRVNMGLDLEIVDSLDKER